MLESVVEEVLLGIRISASRIAWKHGCFVTSTLDVQMCEFPVFPQKSDDGLFRILGRLTKSAEFPYMSYRGVVRYVVEGDPPYIIGVTASDKPRFLVVPTVIAVPDLLANGDSPGFVPAVGVYALQPLRRHPYRNRFKSSPYNEM